VLEERLTNLNDYFTFQLYENICRSLFEKHKLLFSFMLTIKILQGRHELDELEWRYFLTGPQGEIQVPVNPTSYVSPNAWANFYQQFKGMDALACMKGIEAELMTNPKSYQRMFDSLTPHLEPLPEPWQTSLNSF